MTYTLTTRPADMSAQGVFNYISNHLFTQGRRSYAAPNPEDADTPACLYRGPGGLSCAVGCLIPDNMYEREMDRGYSAYTLLGEFVKVREHLGEAHQDLYTDLQSAHDDEDLWQDTASMRTGLIRIAERHHLSPTILDTLSFPDR